MDDDEKLQHFFNQLVDSKTDPGEVHVCPICEGRLFISFGAYKRGNVSMLGVTANCEACGKAMAVDYLMPHPEWLIRS